MTRERMQPWPACCTSAARPDSQLLPDAAATMRACACVSVRACVQGKYRPRLQPLARHVAPTTGSCVAASWRAGLNGACDSLPRALGRCWSSRVLMDGRGAQRRHRDVVGGAPLCRRERLRCRRLLHAAGDAGGRSLRSGARRVVTAPSLEGVVGAAWARGPCCSAAPRCWPKRAKQEGAPASAIGAAWRPGNTRARAGGAAGRAAALVLRSRVRMRGWTADGRRSDEQRQLARPSLRTCNCVVHSAATAACRSCGCARLAPRKNAEVAARQGPGARDPGPGLCMAKALDKAAGTGRMQRRWRRRPGAVQTRIRRARWRIPRIARGRMQGERRTRRSARLRRREQGKAERQHPMLPPYMGPRCRAR